MPLPVKCACARRGSGDGYALDRRRKMDSADACGCRSGRGRRRRARRPRCRRLPTRPALDCRPMPRARSGCCVQCRRASSSATKTNSAVAWSSGSAGRSGVRHWPRYPILSHAGSLAAYQSYWRAALLRATTAREKAEATLCSPRCAVFWRATTLPRWMRSSRSSQVRLRESGHYSLQGMTGPLRELMLWSTQDEREVRVAAAGRNAHDESHAARRFLEPRLERLRDLRTARAPAAGRRAMRCSPCARATQRSTTRSSALAFSGTRRSTSPITNASRGSPQWELEYRAKLTELAHADETRASVLRKFDRGSGRRSGLAARLCQQARAGGASPASRPVRRARRSMRSTCRPAGRGGRRNCARTRGGARTPAIRRCRALRV